MKRFILFICWIMVFLIIPSTVSAGIYMGYSTGKLIKYERNSLTIRVQSELQPGRPHDLLYFFYKNYNPEFSKYIGKNVYIKYEELVDNKDQDDIQLKIIDIKENKKQWDYGTDTIISREIISPTTNNGLVLKRGKIIQSSCTGMVDKKYSFILNIENKGYVSIHTRDREAYLFSEECIKANASVTVVYSEHQQELISIKVN